MLCGQLAVESKYRSQLEVISEVESSIVGLRTHSDLVAQHLDVNVKSVLALQVNLAYRVSSCAVDMTLLQDTVDGLEGKLKSLAGDLSGAMDVVADLSRALTFDFKGIGKSGCQLSKLVLTHYGQLRKSTWLAYCSAGGSTA